jgi:hypothetical protein
MNFQLINQEISEAALYRSSRQFAALDGRTVADMLFLNTLILAFMYETPELNDQAVDYAKKTVQYGTYSLFRSFATDLYMLAYQASNPNNDHVKLRDAAQSKQFLRNLQFQERKHLAFLRRMAQDQVAQSESHVFLHRLESQLKITDSRYLSWRRRLMSWSRYDRESRGRVFRQIQAEFNRLAQGTARRSELLTVIRGYAPEKAFAQSREKSNTGSKLAGAAAGALAGRYIGGKLSGLDQKKAKNIGTGLGAIAGFWSAGRKQK